MRLNRLVRRPKIAILPTPVQEDAVDDNSDDDGKEEEEEYEKMA